MKKPHKIKPFFSILTGFFAALILVAIIIGFVLWSRLPHTVSNYLSQKMRVPVSIESISASFSEIDLSKIYIGNIPRSILANAFTCQKLKISAPLTRYLKELIIIDEIELNAVYLGLEFNSALSSTGNWTHIMENIARSIQSTSHVKEPRALLIRKLIITDLDVDVVYRIGDRHIKRLPRISSLELTNIPSEGGAFMDQITSSVLGEMLKEVFIKENLNNMLKNLLEPKGDLENLIDTFQRFFNAVPTYDKQIPWQFPKPYRSAREEEVA